MADELDDETPAFGRRMFDLAREGEAAALAAHLDAGVPVDLTNDKGDTLLIVAAYHERVEAVAALLARGADHSRVNDRGQTALAAATFRKSVPIVEALLAAGGDPALGAPSAVEVARFFEVAEVLPVLEAGPAPEAPSSRPGEHVEPHPDAPKWFRQALAVPFEDGEVVVDGARVHYLAWGERGRRGLVFVHGGAAQAHWWSHVAAHFAPDLRVVAVDLSGHGDSDHRERYSLEQWTDEVVAVAAHSGIEGRPVVVGHSMGGFVTIATAARHPDRLEGVIICDSPVTRPDPEVQSYRRRDAFGRPRTYGSVGEALEHFRTEPAQRNNLDYVIDHVARRSLRAVEGGWQWKFDRNIFESFGTSMRAIALPYLTQVRCRFALLRSQYGLVTPDLGQEMYESLGRVAPVIELPQTGHHPMIDQPLVLLTALRALLADWDHSEPYRPAARS